MLAGYAFLLYKEEISVQRLMDACMVQDGKFYLCVSSPTIKDKPVRIPIFVLSSCSNCDRKSLDKYSHAKTKAPLNKRKTYDDGSIPSLL